VMQDDDGPMLGREGPEGSLQGIAVVDGHGLVPCRRPVDRQRPDVGAPPAVPPELLVAGIDHEAMKPDLEALGVAEPRELAPGEEDRLLDGVLGPLPIAQDPMGDGVAAVTVEVDQVREGAFVAFPRLLDQPRSH
jgi:hypothetical protein